MRIIIGGVRGSTPRAASRFNEYGGHTTCLLVLGDGGERLLLDVGSGVQETVPHLGDADLLVLMTHLHLDHVMGITGLAPLYTPGRRVRFAAVSYGGVRLRAALDRLHSPPLWPLTLDDCPAALEFQDLDPALLDGPGPHLQHGGLEIRGVPVPHPGGCTAWRVDEPSSGASFVLATDVEWSLAGPPLRERLTALCAGAGLLVMDGHFTPDELPAHAGWGHSSTDECLELARAAGVRRLLVGHHAPANDDARLADIERALHAAWSGAGLARQGDVVDPQTPGNEGDR